MEEKLFLYSYKSKVKNCRKQAVQLQLETHFHAYTFCHYT